MDCLCGLLVANTTSLFEEQNAGPEAQKLTGDIQREVAAVMGKLDTVEARCGLKNKKPRPQSIEDHRTCVLSYFRHRITDISKEYREALQKRTEVCR